MAPPGREEAGEPRADGEPALWLRDGPVVIAGAGIGGLAAALALARAGLPALLLERRTEPAEAGAGIQIGPNGTAILQALGVAEDLRAQAGVPRAIRVHDGRDGRELTRLPLGRWIEARHGAPYWVAHRQDLHAALLAKVKSQPRIKLVPGAAVLRADRTAGEGLSVLTQDGRAFPASALIGADGLWSQVRAAHFTPHAPRPVGASAVRATIPALESVGEAARLDTFVWLRPDAHVVHYPVRAGREIAVVAILRGHAAGTGWGEDVAGDFVRAAAAAFPKPVRALFAADVAWRRWGLHAGPPGHDFAAGRVALLGDAAHPILPFLAQGAVLALEDAMALAGALAGHDDVVRALAAYAHDRQPRARRVAAASERNGRIYHLSGALAAARNLALRHLPAQRIMAGYDWLYGWRG